MKKYLLTVNDVAELLDLSKQTIKRWADSGYLVCVRGKNNNYRYFKRKYIDDIMKERKRVFELAEDSVQKMNLVTHKTYSEWLDEARK